MDTDTTTTAGTPRPQIRNPQFAIPNPQLTMAPVACIDCSRIYYLLHPVTERIFWDPRQTRAVGCHGPIADLNQPHYCALYIANFGADRR